LLQTVTLSLGPVTEPKTARRSPSGPDTVLSG
jgi:hypothetical protein